MMFEQTWVNVILIICAALILFLCGVLIGGSICDASQYCDPMYGNCW